MKFTYKKSQRLLPHFSHTSSHTHMWSQMKRIDLAHLSTKLLHVLPFTQFTIPPSIGPVSIPTAVPLPLMTGSSGSSPSSPNTKPEPLQGRCCCSPKSGFSGSSCASVRLPMPYSKQRPANYVVKSSKVLSNSNTRHLNAFYRILLILPLIVTCGLQ